MDTRIAKNYGSVKQKERRKSGGGGGGGDLKGNPLLQLKLCHTKSLRYVKHVCVHTRTSDCSPEVS